jgi:ABC-2 type transport system ATP-binding protein
MRLMLGLDNGGGRTVFDDKPLHTYAQPSKVVGILLEAKAFHPTRSARNHLTVLAEAGGIPVQRVDEVLEIVGLTDVAKKRPGNFSLGMSQRLGIAAAILGHPKYLMLDEPANGLDPEGVAWLRRFLSDYADQGNAVFVSSHLLSEMQLMADNIVVIGKGKLIIDTSMKELVARGKGSGVFVRTGSTTKLKQLLKSKAIEFETVEDGLKIAGHTTDDIGKLAFEAGVPVLELASHGSSMEDVFLELTETSQEYGTHTGAGGKQ